MHTDGRTLEQGTTLTGDLCIIGAGAAGISLALEWSGSSRRVLLLESGGFDLEAAQQDLARGEIVGRPYFPLEAARLRYFGGTTGHWAGFCAPLDPIDFAERDWVPHSGWPFSRRELDPYYQRAHKLLQLGPYDYTASHWEQADPTFTPLPFGSDAVWTKLWQFSPPTRFGTVYLAAITTSPNVHLVTHVTACELRLTEGRSAVSEVRLRTLAGRAYSARAPTIVVACGAIDNARLLLASRHQSRQGIGNARDLVGRYFMEHIEMPGAELFLAARYIPRIKSYFFRSGVTKLRGELALHERLQRQYRILNATASVEPSTLGADALSTFELHPPSLLEAYRIRTQDAPAAASVAPVPEPRTQVYQLSVRQEQAPSPQSRITLADATDALGVPRVKLDWQLSELDKRSIRLFFQTLGEEFGRSDLGRIKLRAWLRGDDHAWPKTVSGAWHHMGTTRMHEDAARGVVDQNCRVHELANLYIAGASVLPTAGAANPTLTLIALTLRLSDFLKAHTQ